MNVYVLNTMGIGLDTISLLKKQVVISGVIGLSKDVKKDTISDYVYQEEFCNEHDIDFIPVNTYSLSSEKDKNKIESLEIDVLIVSGWQRLIPQWFISHVKICVIGAHGSPLGITKGRGRSPQNWALILGFKEFYISIFKIDSGIDSGVVIDTKKFLYNDFDDIKTSYYKVSILTSQMIIDFLKKEDFQKIKLEKQDDEEAEYFPQRKAEDGKIDWNRTNQQIQRFVKALTKPYPGADAHIDNTIVKIWSLIPFDIDISLSLEIGEIVKIFNTGDILVKTKESYVLIDDYQILSNTLELKEGMIFSSGSFVNQIETIIDRHETKYPNLPISKELKCLKN